MKKFFWLLAGLAAGLAAGCSDDANEGGGTDGPAPISEPEPLSQLTADVSFTPQSAKLVREAAFDKEGGEGYLLTLTDAEGAESPQASAMVYVAHKSIAPSFDGYIHEAFKEQNYTTNETLQLKNGDNWSRRIYITFPTEEIDTEADHIAVRIYFDSYTLGTLNNEKRPQDGIETLEIGGNTAVYGSTLKWSTASSHVFEPISSTILSTNMQNKWVGFDVTDWAKAKVAEGAKHLTFRITTPYRWGSLTNFVASENTAKPDFAPQMLMAMSPLEDGVATVGATTALGFDGSTLTNATGALATVVALDGTVRYVGSDESVDLSLLSAGLYVASAGGNVLKVLIK